MSERDGFDAFLQDYCVEGDEHLSALDDQLLEAERQAMAGRAPATELIHGAFRSIHTLKGMAGMMAFEATAALAHTLESRLDAARNGVAIGAEEFPSLFDALDTLKKLHGRVRDTGSDAGVEIAVAMRALTDAAEAAEAMPAAAAPGAEANLPPDLLARLDPHDRMAALVAAAKGDRLYELEVHPDPDGMADAATWLAGLATIGSVLGVWDGDGLALPLENPPRPQRLLVLVQTAADAACVADWSGVPPERIQPSILPWEATPPPPPPPLPAPGAVAAPTEGTHALEDAPPTGEHAERATSIRVEAARLDRLMELVGELAIHQTRVVQLGLDIGLALDGGGSLDARRGRLEELSSELDAALQSVARVNDELQESTMRLRMVPVRALFNRFPRIVRDLARDLGKRARLAVTGADTELDKGVIEQIGDPLIHLIRNALDHGLEPPAARADAGKPAEGVVSLSARQQGHHIVIEVSDDGRGIDAARVLAKAREKGLVAEGETPPEADVLALIFRPGFSTAAAVTNVSGRGVGMDVVQRNVQRLGGQIVVSSVPGKGTRFTIKLPLTLAITKALLVASGEHTFAVPLAVVEETLRLHPDEIRTIQGDAVVRVRGEVVPFFRLETLFGHSAKPRSKRVPAVIIGDGQQRLALAVDALVGQQDVVVKSLGDFLGAVPGVGGATILGDGGVALILDAQTLLARHGGRASREAPCV